MPFLRAHYGNYLFQVLVHSSWIHPYFCTNVNLYNVGLFGHLPLVLLDDVGGRPGGLRVLGDLRAADKVLNPPEELLRGHLPPLHRVAQSVGRNVNALLSNFEAFLDLI